MRSFAGIRSFSYRLLSVAVVLAVTGLAAAPIAAPARGAAPLRLAVYGFQNSAGAPAATVNALNAALYQAIASGGKFTAVGGGALPVKTDVSGSSFQPALAAAAKVGADEVVVGNIVQLGGGQISYSLSIYRVVDVALVRSQIFSQSYPATDARSMGAALGSNVATLEAPRTAEGTIYSIVNGQLNADLGASEGFKLGQRFNVLRGGQKVAEADISKITDSAAVVVITHATAGYKPMAGDRLVGLDPQPAVIPVHESTTGFNPFYALVGVGLVLAAIGHHGQPAGFNPQPSPSGGVGSFTVGSATIQGTSQTQPITFTFNFTQPFNATTFDAANSLALASCTLPSQGSTQLLLSFLGTFAYTPSMTAATKLTITTSAGKVQPSDSTITFKFFDNLSNNWVDNNNDPFTGVAFTHSLSIGRKPAMIVHRPIPHPGIPVGPGRPVPVVPGLPNPVGPKPGGPPSY